MLDFFDAFPLDSGEQADSDGDGFGDESDADDDGDGVADTLDAFPLRPGEWGDADGDGIGDRLDDDDDNDGILRPATVPSIRNVVGDAVYQVERIAPLRDRRPGFVYQEFTGDVQTFGYLAFGGGRTSIQLAIDRVHWIHNIGEPSRFDGGLARVYFDLNNNGELTDDGPPSRISPAGDTYPGMRISALEIDDSSGGVSPCAVSVSSDRIQQGSIMPTYGMS